MKRFIPLLLALAMILPCFALACQKPKGDGGTTGGGGNTNTPTTVELIKDKTYFDEVGEIDSSTGEEYNNFTDKLFYRNDVDFICADTFVFQCTDETDTENFGKFFLYGTTGVGIFNCFVSDDLTSWSPKAGAYVWPNGGWEKADCWAPELIYDKDADPADYGLVDDGMGTGVYFFYYSASSHQDFLPSYCFQLGLAVGTSPYGPFTMYNGEELGAKIGGVDYSLEENYNNHRKEHDGEDFTYRGRVGDTITNDDAWWNVSAIRASLTFQFENRDKAGNWVDPDGNIVDESTVDATFIPETAKYLLYDKGQGPIRVLDPSPFVDPKTGDRYLYFALRSEASAFIDPDGFGTQQAQSAFAVKMLNNDWTQIDYSSLTQISRGLVNFVCEDAVADYVDQANAFDPSLYPLGQKELNLNTLVMGENNAETYMNDYDCNEGPFVYYNEDTGLYYSVVSIGSYQDGTYSLCQSIAYHPMGPWRKLALEEGGLVLTTNYGQTTDMVTGPGHNSFIKVGDELINVYHKHLDIKVSDLQRGPATDRVVFVKNNTGIYVMHTNGPTNTVQPLIYGTGATEYDNIADEAIVTSTATDKTAVSNLTDGVIPVHDNSLHPYLSEYEFADAKDVITLKFDNYKAITSILIYNSRFYDKAFYEIAKIEMDAKMNGKEFTAVINNLQFYWEKYEFAIGGKLNPGAPAVAVFDELAVKEIRITINNTNDVDLGFSGKVALSEIMVLGKPDYTPDVQGDGSQNIDIAEFPHANEKQYVTYESVTVDGIIDSDEWGDIIPLTKEVYPGGVKHTVTTSAKLLEKGVAVYFKVEGAPVYYNFYRSIFDNSGIELYITDGKLGNARNGGWGIQLSAGGVYASQKYITFGDNNNGYVTCNLEIDLDTVVDGIMNDSEADTYYLEAYIPWDLLGFDEKPATIMMDACVMYTTEYVGKRSDWVSLAKTFHDDYGWLLPQTWFRFNEDGYYDEEANYGLWRVSKYQDAFIVGENGVDITIDSKTDRWNHATLFVMQNGTFNGNTYQQAKFFAPSVAFPELEAYDKDEKYESQTSALMYERGCRITVDLVYVYGDWAVRFGSPWWKRVVLTETQANLLRDGEKGLTIGLMVEGNKATFYVDDGNGVMTPCITVDLNDAGYDPTAAIKLGIGANCDSVIKDYLSFNDVKTIPYVVNGGEDLIGGKVVVTGIGKNAKAVVVPDAGYALDTFTVNGQAVDGLIYQAGVMAAPMLDILVTFKQVDGVAVNLNVQYGFGYTGYSVYADNSVTFDDGENKYFTVTDSNGCANITLPKGSYTVYGTYLEPITVTIDDKTSYDINLLKKSFVEFINVSDNQIIASSSAIDGGNIKYDGAPGLSGENSSKETRLYMTPYMDFSGPVVVTFNYKLQLNCKNLVGIQFYGDSTDDLNYFNIGTWNNENLFVKIYNNNPAIYLDETIVTEDDVKYSKVEFTVMINGQVADLYYKNSSGNIVYVGTCNKGFDINRIAFRSAVHGGTWEISNIKVFEGDLGQTEYNKFSAPVTASSAENVTVKADDARYLKENVITITPDVGYIVKAVKVNGQELSMTLVDGNTVAKFTHNDLSVTSYDVEVTAIKAVITTATISVKTQKGNSSADVLPDDTIVTIENAGSQISAPVTGGIVTFDAIPAGSYKLYIDGYKSYTFDISEDGFDGEVILYYIPFVENTIADISLSNEGKVNFVDWSEKNWLYFKDSGIKFVSMVVYDHLAREASATADYAGTTIRVGSELGWGTHYLGPDKSGTGASLWRLRWSTATWRAFAIGSDLQAKLTAPTIGLKIALAIDGANAYGLVEDGAGNLVVYAKWVKTGGVWGDIDCLCAAAGHAQIKDLVYSTSIPADIATLISNFQG